MNLQIDNHNKFQRFLLRHFRWLDDEKLQKIGYWLLVMTLTFIVLFGFCQNSNAQLVSSNPGEYVAYEAGTNLVDAQINGQAENAAASVIAIGAIDAEQAIAKNWENKYLSYLGDVSTFASKVKEASRIYSEGVKTLLYLTKITKVVSANPEGCISMATQNQMYLSAINEFVSVYNLVKAVAKGGDENLISGKERLKLMYMCDDHLAKLNKKLSQIYQVMCYTTFKSTWHQLTYAYNVGDRASRRAYVARTRMEDLQQGIKLNQKLDFK